ncbi:leukocyte tyrosine kinase [Lynx pardinus]|uniref:Leukocyte tyrosine kinase n=1 Tax=Lynx pardinus TaxID=191816 RepID=A0A485MR19_LYNPA|nr:leukocyte tyrosine kinase [Lynx pardinus]
MVPGTFSIILAPVAASSKPPRRNITTPPSGLDPASPLIPPGTEGPWLFFCGTAAVEDAHKLGGLKDSERRTFVVGQGTDRYLTSAYGAAGSKGAKNHPWREQGVFVSALFSLGRREPLYILVGQRGEDACPREHGAPLHPAPHVPRGSRQSQRVCLGETRTAEEHAATEGAEGVPGSRRRAGGGGAPPTSFGWKGRLDVAGRAPSPQAGRPLLEGAGGGQGCAEAWATLGRRLGGGGGACTAGWRRRRLPGFQASETDILWVDGEDGVSFIHPCSEGFLQPLAESVSRERAERENPKQAPYCQPRACHGHCQWQAELWLAKCMCPGGMELAAGNITCMVQVSPAFVQDLPTSPGPLVLLVTVVTSTLSLLMVCGVLSRGKQHPTGMATQLVTELHGVPGTDEADFKTLASGAPGWLS